ncbi:ferredoxin [Kribbella kalugense]|uniref:Ferredoxin n=1 Tax=Kribbella kalugense TaxID=2512221 RepID=A0A4R8A1W3_9ACTN|nr:ferredoxin [Kribbella kalugense]TDW24196.1 ferredoxin [Kribbella kalugense]
MKVVVDRSACQGTGLCVAVAAEVFEIEDDGAAIAHHELVPAEWAQSVREAVSACPVGALRIVED